MHVRQFLTPTTPLKKLSTFKTFNVNEVKATTIVKLTARTLKTAAKEVHY